MIDTEYLVDTFRQNGFELEQGQIKQFNSYYELLVEWNQKMNLTTITDYHEVVQKHFLDSILVLKYVKNHILEGELIDIGTGAGFPGIPLKILCPNLKVTLLDSLNKRITFLNHVIEVLDLSDVETIHGRAEDFGKIPSHREKYSYVVSRAVSGLSTLCEYSLPVLQIGGEFICYKSAKTSEEMEKYGTSIFVFGGKVERIESFELLIDNEKVQRNFIFIKKIKKTNKKYPRKAGLPQKEPIIVGGK